MFDPTVFDNLKVVLEGSLYDLDLAGSVSIVGRRDLVDLATMSRAFRLDFELQSTSEGGQVGLLSSEYGLDSAMDPISEGGEYGARGGAVARPAAAKGCILLTTGLEDLAAELLDSKEHEPGCSIHISFRLELQPDVQVDEVCLQTGKILTRVWGQRFEVRQTVTQEYGQPEANRILWVQLLFGRRFGEEVTEDLTGILDHAVLTLTELSSLLDDIL